MPRGSRPNLPSTLDSIPLLPLRNSVLFPMSVVPINVGRPRSVRLVEEIRGQDRALVAIVSQRDPEIDDPDFEDLYEIGTLARVVKIIRLGPTNFSVVLNGLGRFRTLEGISTDPYLKVDIERIPEPLTRDVELDALTTSLRESTREVLGLLPNLPKETAGILDNVREPGALADLIASNFPQEHASLADKQEVLEAIDLKDRVRLVHSIVGRQLEVLRVKREISSMVEEEMGKSQREYILRQQMKAIKEELGEGGDDDEIEELRDKLLCAQLPPEALTIARKQLSRISSMHQQSAEFNVTKTYLEWLADLPWGKTTPDRLDVADVKRCLDEDHYGLERVKKRIVEYIAVRKLRRDKSGPILCFVGPPGVGKTSLGRSIARATGRHYGRIALGGVRDEAEIRGHRRTYVSALPGRIMQALKKVGTKNPVLVLDEIDKMGADLRGDPAAALLEVLDPEQNSTFQDHYIDTPFDLSQIVFLATANNLETISGPLRDRMEIIEVPGYTRNEKLAIAREFLVPKQRSQHGITEERLNFTDEGVNVIIEGYTREAGVRGLEREIAAMCRHVAVRLAEGEDVEETVTPELVERVLGPEKYRAEVAERTGEPGVATGLAWTPAGGRLLFVEASKMPGKGRLQLTGNIKGVMQESAATAVSFVRSRAERLHLPEKWFDEIDLHVHIPAGAVAKDGPSAGVAVYAAVVSLMLGVPLRPDVAATGEITLRGNILPVGGIKEKLLAAHRAGIGMVLVPQRNLPDLDDIPDEIKRVLDIRLISKMDEILELVLEAPKPSPDMNSPAEDDP